MKSDLKNAKDKIVGSVKEAVGDLMDDEGLEFKGKMQTMKADIGEKVNDMKEEVLEKTNNLMDKMKNNKDKKY
ncbi:CsbD family protein [Anaeromicropila herbilytica]|uniref:CsbD-like domain-containing protein n=1 Tax=Anaeromicropila herbilytica TaxID=2785025 RepID=A0A7R7ELN9_9FIRM|nr:CsbD family protein [Anaeromicropila herbilytica]BCN31170.1 hypothetical protein bsdtb5_24650 [Anaeromicropila herbilytica]